MTAERLHLPSPPAEHILTGGPLPRVVVIIPAAMPRHWMRGMASKTDASKHEVWMIIAPSDAQPFTLARLLGVLMLDAQEHVIRPHFMPTRPATAYLPADGEMRVGRGKRLASWALEEIDRVAGILLSKHADYIGQVSGALKGGSEAFTHLPPGFIFSDPYAHARIGPPPPAVEIDVSKSERSRLGLSWHQLTAEDYRRNRYMENLTDEELARRVEDIIGNIHIIDASGFVGVEPESAETYYWFGCLGEVATEMILRHGEYPAGWTPGFIDRSRLPGSLDPRLLDQYRPLQPKSPLSDPYAVKYGQRQYMEEAYLYGRLRVAPASLYSDPSLNSARRDEELVTEIQFDPTPLQVVGSYPSLGHYSRGARQVIRQEMNTNYYAYCMASRLSSRLLLDFEADAALVIREPDEFFNRLGSSVRRQLPEWQTILTHVQYYDPLQVTPQEVKVVQWKHFRYAYQREVRIAWLPQSPVHELPPLKVDLGPLTDIAELLP